MGFCSTTWGSWGSLQASTWSGYLSWGFFFSVSRFGHKVPKFVLTLLCFQYLRHMWTNCSFFFFFRNRFRVLYLLLVIYDLPFFFLFFFVIFGLGCKKDLSLALEFANFVFKKILFLIVFCLLAKSSWFFWSYLFVWKHCYGCSCLMDYTIGFCKLVSDLFF